MGGRCPGPSSLRWRAPAVSSTWLQAAARAAGERRQQEDSASQPTGTGKSGSVSLHGLGDEWMLGGCVVSMSFGGLASPSSRKRPMGYGGVELLCLRLRRRKNSGWKCNLPMTWRLVLQNTPASSWPQAASQATHSSADQVTSSSAAKPIEASLSTDALWLLVACRLLCLSEPRCRFRSLWVYLTKLGSCLVLTPRNRHSY